MYEEYVRASERISATVPAGAHRIGHTSASNYNEMHSAALTTKLSLLQGVHIQKTYYDVIGTSGSLTAAVRLKFQRHIKYLVDICLRESGDNVEIKIFWT